MKTKNGKDTYRYRVMDEATAITILPEDECYDPEDDDSKIKILFAGLLFREHSKYSLEIYNQSNLKEKTLTQAFRYPAPATHLP